MYGSTLNHTASHRISVTRKKKNNVIINKEVIWSGLSEPLIKSVAGANCLEYIYINEMRNENVYYNMYGK
jgi:hypothetical protein